MLYVAFRGPLVYLVICSFELRLSIFFFSPANCVNSFKINTEKVTCHRLYLFAFHRFIIILIPMFPSRVCRPFIIIVRYVNNVRFVTVCLCHHQKIARYRYWGSSANNRTLYGTWKFTAFAYIIVSRPADGFSIIYI